MTEVLCNRERDEATPFERRAFKNFAVYVRDSYGASKLLWFSERQDMVDEYGKHLHLLAAGKGVEQVFAFELCAGETSDSWVRAMGG